MTKSYEDDRKKALEDRTKFTDSELSNLEIEAYQGTGRTNPDTYIIKQYPYPTNGSIRTRQKIDTRTAVHKLG